MKRITLFLLCCTMFVLCGCKNANSYCPQESVNKNTKWVCQELDGYFIVDRWQQCFGELKYKNDTYVLRFTFRPQGSFAAHCVEEMDASKDQYNQTDFGIAGEARYRADKCFLIIQRENNHLWNMDKGSVTLTFIKQELNYMADFNPSITAIPEELRDVVFSTPEEAYLSVNEQFKTIRDVIDGKNYSLIIASSESGLNGTYAMIPKQGDGWMAAKRTNTSLVKTIDSKNAYVYVIQYADIEEYFICVSLSGSLVEEFSDSLNSSITVARDFRVNEHEEYAYDVFINIVSPPSDYTICLAGEEICPFA